MINVLFIFIGYTRNYLLSFMLLTLKVTEIYTVIKMNVYFLSILAWLPREIYLFISYLRSTTYTQICIPNFILPTLALPENYAQEWSYLLHQLQWVYSYIDRVWKTMAAWPACRAAKALAQALVLCRGSVWDWTWAWVTCHSSSHPSIIIIAIFFVLCTYLAHNFLSPSGAGGGMTRGNALLRFQKANGKWEIENRRHWDDTYIIGNGQF